MNHRVQNSALPLVALTAGLAMLLLMVRPASAQSGGVAALPSASAPAALITAIDAWALANVDGKPSEDTISRPYLGKPCDGSAGGADGGKWCWGLGTLDETRATIWWGISNSDAGGIAPVVFRRASSGAWAASSESPLPPSTGTGLEVTSSTSTSTAIGGVALIGIAALAAPAVAFGLQRRGRLTRGA